MDTIGSLHLIGIGLLVTGGGLSLLSGDLGPALTATALAVITGLSFNEWQKNRAGAVA